MSEHRGDVPARVRALWAEVQGSFDGTSGDESQPLDSMALVELVLCLEQEFGIALPADEVVRANFADPPSVERLVSRLLGDDARVGGES